MIIEDWDALLSPSIFAQVATFQPLVGGPAESINGIFDNPFVDVFNQYENRDYTFSCNRSQFVVLPIRNDTLTIGGQAYLIITPGLDRTGEFYSIHLDKVIP